MTRTKEITIKRTDGIWNFTAHRDFIDNGVAVYKMYDCVHKQTYYYLFAEDTGEEIGIVLDSWSRMKKAVRRAQSLLRYTNHAVDYHKASEALFA